MLEAVKSDAVAVYKDPNGKAFYETSNNGDPVNNSTGIANTPKDLNRVGEAVDTSKFSFWDNLRKEGGYGSQLVSKIPGMEDASK